MGGRLTALHSAGINDCVLFIVKDKEACRASIHHAGIDGRSLSMSGTFKNLQRTARLPRSPLP